MKVTRAELLAEANRVFGDGCKVTEERRASVWHCTVEVHPRLSLVVQAGARNLARRLVWEALDELERK